MKLTAHKISFAYDDQSPIFTNLSLQLKEGEIVSIVGPSGTGKSTLLKCLAGLNQPSEGSILLGNERILGSEEQLIAGHPEIALVSQTFSLDQFFTVTENINNQLHHLSEALRKGFSEELLQIFGLKSVAHHKSKALSGGEQQRLSMACALAKEPTVLLLDEPFVHFDVHLNKSIGQYIRTMAQLRKMIVVLVTHNGEEALSWADQILMMRQGKITRKYTPIQAYNYPSNLYEGRFFGELNSIYINGKQYLFRPTAYNLEVDQNGVEIYVNWNYTIYRGGFYANYFNLENGKEIVLYAVKELKDTHKIYVKEKKK